MPNMGLRFHTTDAGTAVACNGSCSRCRQSAELREANRLTAKRAWLAAQPRVSTTSVIKPDFVKPEPWDTTGWRVTLVAEGVQLARNIDGSIKVDKTGKPVYTTSDFRSHAAVTHRTISNMKRWSASRVRGSTSTSSDWGVPARPGEDRLGDSRQVTKDFRSIDIAAVRATRPKPNRKRRRPHKSNVIRRYAV